MNLTRATYFIILLVGFQSAAFAQVDTTAVDSMTVDSIAADSLDMESLRLDSRVTDSLFYHSLTLPIPILQSDTTDTVQTKEEKMFTVMPWEFHAPVGATLAETDSTLRWQMWPDWSYKLNREPGVISYRLGTSIRSNAVQRHAHEPRHQQLYWEGISLNNPVSGMVNWALIPQHKIASFYEKDLGTQHRSTFYQHQYYLNKPLSRLIYTESKFTHRDLEFEVSHNLSQRMNIELSYWDRRTGGAYPNSEITGRQIYAKSSYHLDKRRYLKLNFINNSYEIGQPFGYNITNPYTFNFDRFTTTANDASALSNEATSLLALNYYQRSADTTKAVDNLHAGLFYRTNERMLNSSSDSTGYTLKSAGVNAKKWITLGGLTLEGSVNYEQFFNQSASDRSLPASDWSLLKTEGNLSLDFTDLIDLKGDAEFRLRSGGFQSYRLNATSDIELAGFTLTPGASMGSIMPTPQQLYWNSTGLNGNPDLENEKIKEVRGTLSYHFTPDTEFGIRAQHKDVTDGIMLMDSTFTNVPNYGSQSATAFFEWDMEHFELNGSATVHRFTDSYTDPSNAVPMSTKERIWLKGGAYWKGYLFDRATYVKAGVSGMMAPFRYQADSYNPVLDYWQPVSDDQELPLYNRLDVDVSARVRSIMFILRWENVLDDVYQLGYFETAQRPMSQRRFIFGVRALFRN